MKTTFIVTISLFFLGNSVGYADELSSSIKVSTPKVIKRFIKIDEVGKNLPDTATQWSCIFDKKTKLMWESKTNDNGLHDIDNTFAWYNPNAETNGGDAGFREDICNFMTCNTDAFLQAVNTAGWCGHNDWRIPTVEELFLLADRTKYNPAIDTVYFPDTKSLIYWSYSPFASYKSFAWNVEFGTGAVGHAFKSSAYYVRLVRGNN